jgi:hypothetical protein
MSKKAKETAETKQPDSPQKEEKKSSVNKILIIIIILLLLLLLCGACAAIYFFFIKDKDETETENETSQDEDTSTSSVQEEEVKVLDGKIIYRDTYNLYMADKDGGNKIKLTSFSESESGLFIHPQLVSDEAVGFGRCTFSGIDQNCKIYLLDITTKEIETIKTFTDEQLNQLGFYTVDEYAYAYYSADRSTYQINYVKDEDDSKIVDLEPQLVGRGGFLADTSRLRFSPNGESILHIDTSSCDGMNFTLYVYDLEGNEVDEVEGVTFPAWKDDETVVYRTFSMDPIIEDELGGIYERDVELQQSTKVSDAYAYPDENPAFNGGYNLDMFKDRVIYWGISGPTSVGYSYYYDFSEEAIEEANTDAVYPVWLSSDEIIFAATRAATEDEYMIPDSFSGLTELSIDEFDILDLTTGETTKIDVETDWLFYGVITEGHEFMNY